MSEQVTVFGANGNVGSLVVRELLARGYTVVAFVHGDHHLPVDDALKIVRGDIYNTTDVDVAIAGSMAIISALGSWGTQKKDILTVGMAHITASMERYGVSRIVSLTGAEARMSGDSLSIIHRIIHAGLGMVAGKVLMDGERHIELLENSSFDWTVIRSPVMTADWPKGRQYHLTLKRPLPWQLIPTRLVVLCMVDLIFDTTWRRNAPYIS